MRRPVSGRDAVRSQVIDVLEAQIKRRPAMKKISTATTKQSKNFSEPKLTIGLDLGDRSSWYCVLDEAGAIVLEQKLGTTPKAVKEVFGRWGLKLAERGGKSGKKRAIIAVARKLAVLLHHLWVSGEVYQPLRLSKLRAMPAAA
jgi:hypothetical protein